MWLPNLFNRVKVRTSLHLNFFRWTRSIWIILTCLTRKHYILGCFLSSHRPRIMRGIRSGSCSIVFEYSLCLFLLTICLIQQYLIIFDFLKVVYRRWGLRIYIFLRCFGWFIWVILRLYLSERLAWSLLSRFTHWWVWLEIILLLFNHWGNQYRLKIILRSQRRLNSVCKRSILRLLQ